MHISKFKPCVSHEEPYAITVPTLEEYDAQHANSGTTGKSGKWTSENTNTVINAGGSLLSSLLDIFKPADQNTTYVVSGGGSNNNNNQRDNTMLYVGIGGVVLVVILFAVIALKK